MTFDYLGAMSGHNWQRALQRSGDYLTGPELEQHVRRDSTFTDSDYEALEGAARAEESDRYGNEPQVLAPAGSWLSGIALRWAEYANVKRNGEWVRETFTRSSFGDKLPNRTPVRLGHLGRQIGTVELWDDRGDGLEFDMRLTEPVKVRRGMPVSIGFVQSEDEDIIIESRGGRAFVVPQRVELDHLALLIGYRDGAYPSARITGIEIERRDQTTFEIEHRPAGPIIGIR